MLTLDTYADIALIPVDASVTLLHTAGYYASGDGGGADYVRSDTLPAQGGATSLDGAHWALDALVANVLQFGVKRDGTVSTARLRAAVAWSEPVKALELPPGDILVDDTVLLPAGLELRGVQGATRIINGTTDKPAIDMGDGVTLRFGGGVIDVQFASKAGIVPVAGQCGLRVRKCSKFRVERCLAFKFPAALYDGIVIEAGMAFKYQNNDTEDCLNVGTQWIDCNDVYAKDNISDANAVGLLAIGTSGVQGDDFTCYGNDNAFYLARKAGHPEKENKFWFVKGFTGDTSLGENWKVTSLRNSVLVDPWASSQKSFAIPAAPGMRFSGNSVSDVTLVAPIAVNNNGSGIVVHDCAATPGGDSELGAPVNITIIAPTLGSWGDLTETDGNGNGGTGYGLDVDGAATVLVLGGAMLGNPSGPYRDVAGGGALIIRDALGPAGRIYYGDARSIDHAAVSILAGTGLSGGGTLAASRTLNVSGLTTAEFAANVVDTDTALAANSDTRVATQKAVKAYADNLIAAQDAMVFKGVVDCSTNPNYSAADRGHTYRVSVTGKIGGASGINVEAGDMLICLTDGTAAGNQATVGSAWGVVQANIDGAVINTRQVISGAGLTGGGDLSADRTLAVGAGTGITVNADDVALADMAQSTVKGRAVGAGTGAPTDLSAAQIAAIVGSVGGALMSKIVTITRDLSSTDGNVAYTGVGFQPSALLAMGRIGSSLGGNEVLFAMADSAKVVKDSYLGGSLITTVNHFMNFADTGGTNVAAADVASYDSDGFTLTWLHAGSPTGTAIIYVLCLR